MKVQELIAKLEKCDPDAQVQIAISEYYKKGPQYWVAPFGEHLNCYVEGRVGIKVSLPNFVYTAKRKQD